jgi:hypothetical protein
MKVTPVRYDLRIPPSTGRSKGEHVSEVIRDIAIKVGILKINGGARDADANEPDPSRICAGLAWEEWIHAQHPELLYHPGEFLLGGIAMSPDGVSHIEEFVARDGSRVVIPDHKAGIIHEFKFTWKSMNREANIQDEWMWAAQTMAYCKALGTRRSWWHIYWVNGDYRDSGPKYRVYDILFTEREIEENWMMIQNHKKGKKS